MMNHVVWGGPNAPELNAALAHWACEKLDITRGFGPCTTMGVFKDATDPIAVMVYHNWMPENGVIEISGAATTSRWLTRPVLWEMFSYPFNQLGNQLVVMRVSERNRRENGRGLPAFSIRMGSKPIRFPVCEAATREKSFTRSQTMTGERMDSIRK